MKKTVWGILLILILIAFTGCSLVQRTTTIQVTTSEGGKVTGGGTYQLGQEVILEASPDPGYTFVAWLRADDSEYSQSSSLQLNAEAGISLKAVFAPVVIQASAQPHQGGLVTVSEPAGDEALVTITSAPQPGYVFKYWLEGSSVISTEASLSFPAKNHRQLLAVFEAVSITTSANPSQAGFTNVSGPTGAEAQVTLTAAPIPGYVFLHWLENDNIVSTEPVKSFSATQHRQLEAVFTPGLTPIDGSDILAPVSKKVTLGKYAPPDLKTIPAWITGGSTSHQLRQDALSSLIQMAEAAKEEGITLKVLSAYRSYQTQSSIFANNVRLFGETRANSFSARPGQSEHQLGTTVDFGGTTSDWNAGLADTDLGKWLSANAHRYGFVLSYPFGTEHITGYIYEPWHWRYVGVTTAAAITKAKLTPMEYLDELYVTTIR